jgi:hypothetical protein
VLEGGIDAENACQPVVTDTYINLMTPDALKFSRSQCFEVMRTPNTTNPRICRAKASKNQGKNQMDLLRGLGPPLATIIIITLLATRAF